jgi:hypothetical protein
MTIDEQKIHNICKKHNIKNYTINPDGSIDVDGDVLLYNRRVSKIPIKFNKVSGYFYCSWEDLTTLEGSPKHVGGWFDCSDNKLKTLKHSPSIISGLFYCIDNPLESLEGLNIPISKLHCNNKEKLIRKTKLKILESL